MLPGWGWRGGGVVELGSGEWESGGPAGKEQGTFILVRVSESLAKLVASCGGTVLIRAESSARTRAAVRSSHGTEATMDWADVWSIYGRGGRSS